MIMQISRLFLGKYEICQLISKYSFVYGKRMSSTSGAFNVLHDKNKQIFYIDLEKGNALLEYNLKKDVIDMYHTEVPVTYRGQGIAKYLVKDAMNFARENSLRVLPTCTYVLKYVKENPDPSIEVLKL